VRLAETCLAALGAAVLFAVSAVLQQRDARRTSSDDSLHLALFADLAARRGWLAGVAAMVIAYGLEATALGLGDVAIVEPIVVTELVFAVPIAAHLHGRSIGGREWAGLIAITGGVSAFLRGASPVGGTSEPALDRWLYGLLPAAAVIVVLVAAALHAKPATRAGLLAGAAGVSFGLLSLVTKSAAGLVEYGGIGALVTSWQPEVLCVLGIGGFLVAQSAYQAGPLASSLPVLDAVQPTVAVLLAATVLGERIALRPGNVALELLGACSAVLGVFLLGRSPVVLALYERESQQQVPRDAADPRHGPEQQLQHGPGAGEVRAPS
jgi:drug/metabolite transporter (DMT)-like permease